jgi:poly-beta-1,6-N-acetyl-D-glucosamine synthase
VTPMAAAFWLSCAFIAYVYVGYPALLWLIARLRGRADRATPAAAAAAAADALDREFHPPVSIIVAARNEGSQLPRRLDNLLRLDYPPARRQIIVVSDGSTDDTLAVLRRYSPAVDVVALSARGKAAALNAGVERARHGLLVFADARQSFASDTLTELTSPFRDPTVGAVSGELVMDGESAGRRTVADRRATGDAHVTTPLSGTSDVRERRTGPDRRRTVTSTIADGIGLYWRYEKQIRRYESALGSMLGVTGAVYAMRRSLWKPLPADTILDDVLAPMRAVLAGYRVVFNERARAFDRVAPDADAESRRKVRTLAGNYQILWLEPRLLLPWRNPVWLQYLSHKIGRLLVPYALLTLFASSVVLAERAPIYAAALAGQCLFYVLAGYGAWLDVQGTASRQAAQSGSVAWPEPQPIDRPGAVNA